MVNVYLSAARVFVSLTVLASVAAGQATKPALAPLKAGGIYDAGERAGWKVSGTGKYAYTVKRNNTDVIGSGEVDLSSGEATVAVTVNEPAMLYAEFKPASGDDKPIAVAGAAVAPTKLQPVVARPDDFDAFWESKIKALRAVPANPVLTPRDIGQPQIDYGLIQMDHVDGKVHGQWAKPKGDSNVKRPAMLILQWASPPYPLQPGWITEHAKQGWLVLNIQPHDVLPTEPQAYYDALPKELKNYNTIGMDDRDRSYFVRMYLAGVRAADYLTARPDWDGKTFVVMGTSMGGQQSLCVAGLHEKVTHVIVNEPAGCDTSAPLHGRQIGYPFFPADNPAVMRTALYVDPINFAPRITATSLVSMGFVDTVTPPAGIWTAFNLIKGPKEAAPMFDSPHNHQATPEQQRPFTERSAQWLAALAKGEKVEPRSGTPAAPAKAAFDDHRDMMNQLGLKAMRPGANPNDPATFDESKANAMLAIVPDALRMKDGTKAANADQWPARRAELVEDFERELYGRIPKDVPKVTWELTATTPGETAGVPTITKTLVGRVDNSAYPQITVNIEASFTVPANAKSPVPMMLIFGRGTTGGFGRRAPAGKPWTEIAIAHGWGFGHINPGSIQPDNNSFTTAGVIGLMNKGKPRTPEQWGALRAWAWGVSRLVDYFEATPDAKVDPRKVGIEGVSRYGKAALVTQAFDERVAVSLVASSGQGGAKLHRRAFGERVENLTGGLYYWMAGNYLKYGASDPAMTAADLPVDSHEFIALCAPRPCFISYGTVEGGDPHWVDARGSFMAGVLASPVYELLGKRGFGVPADQFLSVPLPPVGHIVDGDLAWRQHEGGHDVTPNWPAFFDWIAEHIPADAPAAAAAAKPASGAAVPTPRGDANSRLAHEQLLAKAKQGRIDVYFLGDSITRRWGTSDPQYKDLLANWTQNFHGYNAGNFGWGADGVQHMLWRIENGELDGVNPKVIVIQGGTNNLKSHAPDDITAGIRALVDACRSKAPAATIVLTAVFPRDDDLALLPKLTAVNESIAKFADGKTVRFLNVNDRLADASGKLYDGMAHDGLHLTAKGYQVWADGLKPVLAELLGPPAKEDLAPPPTGDPSLAKSK